MLITGAIIFLIITLALSKYVKKSKVFVFFYLISLACVVMIFISVFSIGEWNGMIIALIFGVMNIIAMIGMVVTVLIKIVKKM
ncbi:hypothetical protein ACQKP0_15310 [Heyndrickxia sp. NPDC080065]|uniref:hypothetical protein n=1 Tax=Heyndrickxia sp. NPDC080065 TaxID=3390568 RepID=UPI003D042A93